MDNKPPAAKRIKKEEDHGRSQQPPVKREDSGQEDPDRVKSEEDSSHEQARSGDRPDQPAFKSEESGQEEPDRVKSEEDSPSQQEEQVQDVVVEFKFSSMHTVMVPRDGCMKGTLHVPMVQNSKTGRCKLKEGTTQAKGKAKFRYVRFGKFKGTNNWDFENEFTASFIKTDGKLADFKIGYHLTTDQEDTFFLSLVNSENVTPEEEQADYNTSYEFQAYPKYQEQKRDICQKRLEEWESKAGGMLVNYASAHMKNKDIILEACPHIREADHKIKLYTVLSAHSPKSSEDIINVKDDAVPNWKQLRSLLQARFPERGRPWCEKAIKNYIYFLGPEKGAQGLEFRTLFSVSYDR